MIRKSEHPSYTKKEIRGCIDLGSSYFRLLVVEGVFPSPDRLEPEGFELSSFKEYRCFIGWGEDLAAHGAVSQQKLLRALRSVVELIAIAREWGCERPLLVGTNTLRESRNASEVVARLEGVSHEPVRVLSPYEEAARGFTGAAFFRSRDEAVCLIDVGGTSSELSWGRGVTMNGFHGMPLGVHRVQALLRGASGTRRAANRLAHDLRGAGGMLSMLNGGVYRLPLALEKSTILVTGGTAVSLAIVLRHMRGEAPLFEELDAIRLDDVALVRRRVSGLLRAGRERMLPLDTDRSRLLPAGSILIEALLLALRIRMFRVTAKDLRWGVVLTAQGGRVTNEQTGTYRRR
jgi:exopolyphosphatase/guanosine-5'-triphosphate,3'-diphosphate pyrophosphatase